MSAEWIDWNHSQPDTGKLVLVEFEFDQGLRLLSADGDLYDENDNYDDSGETPMRWMEIPA